jgi:hypothetical protein
MHTPRDIVRHSTGAALFIIGMVACSAPHAQGAGHVQSAAVVPKTAVPRAAVASQATVSPTAVASQATVSPASVSPASAISPAARATAIPGVAGTAPSSSPAAGANQIPRNLFQLGDNAIIIVGGKPARASQIKAQIDANLARAPGGKPSTFRLPARKSNGGRTEIASALGATTLPLYAPSQAGSAPSYAGAANARRRVQVERLKSCPELDPEVARTRGTAASGGSFTAEGYCFGDQAGSVELIGQFPGGVLRPSFQQWTENRIVVVMPSLRGVPDQTIALTVVRADQRRSVAYKTKFVAARERIEVPAGYWSPVGVIDQTHVTEGGGNIFTGFHATGAGGQVAGDFRLHVNPQCALDNLEIPTSAGSVVSVSGFENGPANEAAITVTYVPNCTTRTTNYVVGSDYTEWCRIAFQLRTWGYCPAGTTP